jgi:Putative inner membrane exporter, YdcZ
MDPRVKPAGDASYMETPRVSLRLRCRRLWHSVPHLTQRNSPYLSAATFFALFVAGQMLGSIAFDHFGLSGVPVHPVRAIRIAGAALLVGGVILIRLRDKAGANI